MGDKRKKHEKTFIRKRRRVRNEGMFGSMTRRMDVKIYKDSYTVKKEKWETKASDEIITKTDECEEGQNPILPLEIVSLPSWNWNMDGTLQNNSSVKVKEDDDSLISEPEIKSEIVISENEFSVDEPAAKLRKTPDTASTSGMLNTSVRSNEDEECTIFGNYVGSQLKKMSSETRTLCQLNIQKLISEALLNEIHAGSTAFRIDVVNTTGAIQIKKENPDD